MSAFLRNHRPLSQAAAVRFPQESVSALVKNMHLFKYNKLLSLRCINTICVHQIEYKPEVSPRVQNTEGLTTLDWPRVVSLTVLCNDS